MVGYDIDFSAILRYELHDKAFGELTNLIFPCIIQSICDEAGVLELPGFNERVTATSTVQTRTMKGLACPGTSRRPRQ